MKRLQGLPHLEGMRGRIVRAIYVVLLIPTVAVIAGSIWFSAADMLHNFPATMSFGFRTFTDGASGHHLSDASDEAVRAGVREGDRIVAVDGVPVRRGATEFEVGAVLGAVKGEGAVLALRGTDGAVREVRLRRDAHPWLRTDRGSGLPLWAFAISHGATQESFPLIMLVASLLLYRRRPRDPEAMLFAFSLLVLCVRGGSLWWWQGSPFSRDVLQSWWILGWIGSFVAIAGFPDGRFVSRPARWSAALLLGLAATLPLLLVPHWLGIARGAYNLLLLAGALGAGVAVVLRYRRTPPGAERQQIKWAVGGFCITLAALVLLVAFEASGGAAMIAGNPLAYVLAALVTMLTAVALPAGLIVSLLRFRLYDAEATMSRSAVYAVLTVTLIAIFAGSEKVLEALSQQYFGGSLGALAGGVGAALAAVMIAPLHHRLRDWSERRFQQALVALRQGLPLLVGDMRETASLPELAHAVLKRIEVGVRSRQSVLLVGDQVLAASHVSPDEIAEWRRSWIPREGEGLDCAREDPRFPMRVPLEADGCGRVGWLLLGPRPDGSFYGKDEREALHAVGDPVARAISIVQRRESRQAGFERRINALESAIARLASGPGAMATG